MLDRSRLKAAENSLYVTQMIEFLSERVENIVGKRENADYHNVFFSHNIFKKRLPVGDEKLALHSKG